MIPERIIKVERGLTWRAKLNWAVERNGFGFEEPLPLPHTPGRDLKGEMRMTCRSRRLTGALQK
jgi:hypothetical protein